MKKLAAGAGALLVLWAGVFLVYLPTRLGKALHVPLTASPADVGLAFEDVDVPVPDEGLTLRGWWMPVGGDGAAVLFVHGGNANKEDTYFGGLDWYAALVARGHPVLAFDLRNHGASDHTPSGRLGMGLEEHRDVSAALSVLAERAPGRLLVGSGVSMGGAALLEAAARDPRLAALVLVDPLLDPRSATLGALHAMLGLPEALLAPTAWSAASFFGLGRGPTPLETGASLRLPILLIQDPDDPVTRARFAAALARANPNVVHHVMPPAAPDHPVMRESGAWGSHAAAFRIHPEETLAQVTQFLDAL